MLIFGLPVQLFLAQVKFENQGHMSKFEVISLKVFFIMDYGCALRYDSHSKTLAAPNAHKPTSRNFVVAYAAYLFVEFSSYSVGATLSEGILVSSAVVFDYER